MHRQCQFQGCEKSRKIRNLRRGTSPKNAVDSEISTDRIFAPSASREGILRSPYRSARSVARRVFDQRRFAMLLLADIVDHLGSLGPELRDEILDPRHFDRNVIGGVRGSRLQCDTPTAGNREERPAVRKIHNLFQSEHIAIESDRRIPFVHKINRRLHPPYWHWGPPRELRQVSWLL